VPGLVQGYVLREACSSTEIISGVPTTVAGDFVCVFPYIRAAILAQNEGNGGFAPHSVTGTGQKSCNAGYVWREACGPNDKVGRTFFPHKT
jgi:hypothetical protein